MANLSLSDQIGRVLGGRYRLIAPLGSGSSAQVFVADDTKLKRRVAVKVLHSALAEDQVFLGRFRTEAQSAASLNHAHIMAVYDWGDEDVPFLVSEFLGGGSMRSMLDRGELSPSQVLSIGLDALRGLDHAHKEGLVHRDIKPGNLLFDGDGRLRIADFGLARALAEAGWTEPANTVLGTARYASPEQAQGRTLSGKSDVYALAISMYEALTGEVPFLADTAIGTLMARIDQELPHHEALGVLEDPLRQATMPDVDDRLDAAEFGVALGAVAGELPRPEPLPLAGSITYDALPEVDPDPTMIGDPTMVGSPELLGKAKIATGVAADPVDRPVVASVADPDDYVVARRWPWMVFFVLLAAGIGVGGYFLVQVNTAELAVVPDLVGVPREDALETIAGNGWILAGNLDRSNEVATGEIISTDPASGAELAEGETIEIWVSIGPTLVELPTVVSGVALSEIERRLTEVGLVLGDVSQAVSEDVPADLVIRLLTGEADAELGSAIPVEVSLGPAPRQLPEGLVGSTCEAASEVLVGLRLFPDCTNESSSSVPVGDVISVDPPEGSPDVAVGATVTLTISTGPAPKPFPDVIGDLVEDANSAIRNAGFCIEAIDGPPDGRVTGQDPLPDELTVPDGNTCATLTTRDA